jgi:hypothetical protein
MNHFIHKVHLLLLALLITAGAIAGGAVYVSIAHATTITPIAAPTLYLYAGGINSTATSITVTFANYSATTTDIMTADLGDKVYLTIEPGNINRQEIVSCTGITQNADNTATFTTCTRGLQPKYPYTTDSTLKKQHPGGSIVSLSNPPQLYNDIIAYVNAAIFAGAADATTIVKGLVELATGAEIAASTPTGGSGPLAIPASLATSTYNSATAANRVVVTGSGGKIDDNFIATSTLLTNLDLATTTIIGDFPAWSIGTQLQVFSTAGATTSFSVPSGIARVAVQVVGGGGNGASGADGGANDTDGGGGGGGGCAWEIVNVSATTSIQLYVGAAAEPSKFGTNGFYLSATGGASGSGKNGGAGGSGSGGDVNVTGQAGAGGTSGTPYSIGHPGGSSCLGGGGSAGDSTGGAGGNYGGGGGGGSGEGSDSGGSGAQGIVIVRW